MELRLGEAISVLEHRLVKAEKTDFFHFLLIIELRLIYETR